MAPRSRLVANGPSSLLLDGNGEDVEKAAPIFASPSSAQKKYSPIRALAKLFLAPALMIVLSVVFTSRYATLILVFLSTTAKPVFYWLGNGKLPFLLNSPLLSPNNSRSDLHSSSGNNGESGFSRLIFEQYIENTWQTQKSMVAQFAVLASFIWIYQATTKKCGGDKNVHQAFDNAYSIIKIEHYLGIDVEPDWQQAFKPYKVTMFFLSNWYAQSHFVIPSLTAGWLMFTGKDTSYKFRASFAFMLCLAMVGYWFTPTMPPRLLRRYANTYPDGLFQKDENMTNRWLLMIDSLKEEHSTYDKLHSAMGNPYAAMPSMHTGWALWSCLSIWDGLESSNLPEKMQRFIRSLAVTHCFVIMLATIVTANHYILDLIAGITCVVLGMKLAHFCQE